MVHPHVDSRGIVGPQTARAGNFGDSMLMDQQCPRERIALEFDNTEFGPIGELAQDAFEESARNDWRSQISHVASKDAVEVRQEWLFSPGDLERLASDFFELAAQF